MEEALQQVREGVEEVCIQGFRPSAAEIHELFDALRQGTSKLGFGHKCLELEVMPALASRLAENDTLTGIDLEHNMIDPEGARAVAMALETNKTLTSIYLPRNMIGDAGTEALAKALETNKTLTSIDVSSNMIGDEGAQAVAKALETNKTLTSINVSSNMICDEGARAVAKVLETNRTLTSINLSGNKIGPEGAKALAKALETNKTLASTNLSGNKIGSEGAQAVAKALETNKTLMSINLSRNETGPEAARALAKALEINETLTGISLSMNMIGPVGAQALAKALEANKTVTTIYLFGNDIGTDGVQALAKALETNNTLTSIYLSRNKIGPEGAQALAKALETNETLTSINLFGNEISTDGARAIAKALETNKALTELGLDGGAESVTFFVQALRSNATLQYLRLKGVKVVDIPVDVVAALNQVIHLGKTGLGNFIPNDPLDDDSKAILAANQARYDAEAAGPTRVAQGATRALDDSRFGQDRLGYVPYAQALADAATSAQSPGQSVSIGLFARWGSGKSFLMEKLKLELRRTALLPAATASATTYLVIDNKAAIRAEGDSGSRAQDKNTTQDDDDSEALYNVLADALACTRSTATVGALRGLFGCRQTDARRRARDIVRAMRGDKRLSRYGAVALGEPQAGPGASWRRLREIVRVWAWLWWRIPTPFSREAYDSQVRAAAVWFVVLGLLQVLPLVFLAGHLVRSRARPAGARPAGRRVAPHKHEQPDLTRSGQRRHLSRRQLVRFEEDITACVAGWVLAVKARLWCCSCAMRSRRRNEARSADARAAQAIPFSSSFSEVVDDKQHENGAAKADDHDDDDDDKVKLREPVEVTMPVFVEFNAWVYNGSDVLWAGLVRELYTEVEAVYGASRVREHRAWIARYMAVHGGSWPRELDSPDERKRELERFMIAEAAREKRRWVILAVCAVVGYFVLSWLGTLVTCTIFDVELDGALGDLCSCSAAYSLVTGVACAEPLFRDGAVGSVVAALVTLPTLAAEGIVVLRSNLRFTRRFLWRSQGDVLFAEAQKAAEIKDRLGFMNRIKSELDFLFEFLRTEPLYETEGDSEASRLCVKVRLVVFVDDIDRCDKKTIVTVLEAVILLLVDAPITCFMAIDARMVCTSIEDAHGDTFARAGVSGQEYLDKIIQIPFCLPDLHEDKKRPFVYNLVCRTSTLSHALAHMESVARALDWDDAKIAKAQAQQYEGEKEGPPTPLIKLAKLVHALMEATDPDVLRDVKALLDRAIIEGDARTESNIKEIVSTWCPTQALDKLVPPYAPPPVDEPPPPPPPRAEPSLPPPTPPPSPPPSVEQPLEAPTKARDSTSPKAPTSSRSPAPEDQGKRDRPRPGKEEEQQRAAKAVIVARKEQAHATATMFALDEAAAIGQFSRVLDGNPRHVKRVVNVYNVQRFVVRLLLAPKLSPTAVQVTLRQLLKLTIAIEQWPYRMAWLMALVDRVDALKRRLGHMKSEENVLLEDPDGSKARLRAFLRQQLVGQDVDKWTLLEVLRSLGRPLSLRVGDTELKRYEQMDRDVDGLWDLLNHEPPILAGEVRRPVVDGEWTLRGFVFNQRPGLHEFVGRALEKALGGFDAELHTRPTPAPAASFAAVSK